MKKRFFFFPILLFNFLLMAQLPEGVDSSHLITWPTFFPVLGEATYSKPLAKIIALPNGLQLEYAEQGDEGGTPVILLHGFTDSWRSYETVLPYLPPSLRVFALSLRGHGNSSKEAATYNPVDFAADVAAFMKVKRIKEAVIVGHSMGSTVAQCFAVNHPTLAKAILLTGSFAAYDRKEITEFKAVIDGLTDPVDSVFVAGFQQSTVLQPTPGLSLDTVVAESRKVPARVWRGVASGWTQSDFRKSLGAYRKPALIVWGDKDGYCPLADQQALHKILKASTLKVYENTGHALHWEAPKRFADDLLQFVQSLPSTKHEK